jgi:uncharacterized protein (TIGR02271 family)
MADRDTVLSWRGQTMCDADGDKIGEIKEIYLDDATGEPEWALVSTGLFGSKATFVPVARAHGEGDQVRVDYDKATVKDAPGVEADQELSEDEEAKLYRHYGMEYSQSRSDSDRDVSGPTSDQAMTRSEEELRVGSERRELGHARLRKYVETERVTETVPTRREQVRVEREPVTEGSVDAAADGPVISEEEHEVTLTEERPVVEKTAVPKERIRLDTETVTDEETVSEDVRRERVAVDEPADADVERR